MQAFTDWLAATSLSQAIQNLLWIVPAVQTVHLVAVAAVLGSMLMILLRVLGFASRYQTLNATVGRYLPWVWNGVLVLAVTGLLLIIGEPARTLGNPAFWTKMVLLAIVLVAALGLRRSVRRGSPFALAAGHRGAGIRAAVALNFSLWCAVAVAGRWIAYVTT